MTRARRMRPQAQASHRKHTRVRLETPNHINKWKMNVKCGAQRRRKFFINIVQRCAAPRQFFDSIRKVMPESNGGRLPELIFPCQLNK